MSLNPLEGKLISFILTDLKKHLLDSRWVNNRDPLFIGFRMGPDICSVWVLLSVSESQFESESPRVFDNYPDPYPFKFEFRVATHNSILF